MTHDQDILAEWKQAAGVEAGLRREFAARIDVLESALHEAKNYVKRNHKSKGAWWDDPRAYEMITKIIEPALQQAKS